MKKYIVSANITLTVEDLPIYLDDGGPMSSGDFEDELCDAIVSELNKRLVLLDIKGSRSGDDGIAVGIDCEEVTNWNRQ